jgi:hypothetical protein
MEVNFFAQPYRIVQFRPKFGAEFEYCNGCESVRVTTLFRSHLKAELVTRMPLHLPPLFRSYQRLILQSPSELHYWRD